MIVEERSDQLVIINSKGSLDTKPKTDYFMLKYKEYNGNRIYYKFSNKLYIQETFNDGIFNCFFNDESIQIRQADKIAFCITWHKYNKDPILSLKPYTELFKKNYTATMQTDLLKQFLKQYETRLKFLSDGIEIDNRFFVNKNATASFKKKGVYHFLCIVASGYLKNFNIETKIGSVDFNSKTLEIIAKVLFLLNPNVKDKIFFDQLDEELQTELLRDQGDR